MCIFPFYATSFYVKIVIQDVLIQTKSTWSMVYILQVKGLGGEPLGVTWEEALEIMVRTGIFIPLFYV